MLEDSHASLNKEVSLNTRRDSHKAKSCSLHKVDMVYLLHLEVCATIFTQNLSSDIIAAVLKIHGQQSSLPAGSLALNFDNTA